MKKWSKQTDTSRKMESEPSREFDKLATDLKSKASPRVLQSAMSTRGSMQGAA